MDNMLNAHSSPSGLLGGQAKTEISCAQRNWWSNDGHHHWFYIWTPRYTSKDEDGNEFYRYTLSCKMGSFEPNILIM